MLRIVRIALAERHYWFLVTITVSKRHSWSSETPSDPQLAKRTTIRSTTGPAYHHQINNWSSLPPSDQQLAQRTAIRSTSGPAYHHQIYDWCSVPPSDPQLVQHTTIRSTTGPWPQQEASLRATNGQYCRPSEINLASVAAAITNLHQQMCPI